MIHDEPINLLLSLLLWHEDDRTGVSGTARGLCKETTRNFFGLVIGT